MHFYPQSIQIRGVHCKKRLSLWTYRDPPGIFKAFAVFSPESGHFEAGETLPWKKKETRSISRTKMEDQDIYYVYNL